MSIVTVSLEKKPLSPPHIDIDGASNKNSTN